MKKLISHSKYIWFLEVILGEGEHHTLAMRLILGGVLTGDVRGPVELILFSCFPKIPCTYLHVVHGYALLKFNPHPSPLFTLELNIQNDLNALKRGKKAFRVSQNMPPMIFYLGGGGGKKIKKHKKKQQDSVRITLLKNDPDEARF